MSQTVTSSDLIPNENRARNKTGICSSSTFILPVKLLYHIAGGMASLWQRADGWSRFAADQLSAHSCTAAIAAEMER